MSDSVQAIAPEHDIVPAHLAVKAMRDNGYKNAAFALAELMDNAIQAGATDVELLCGEVEVQLKKRTSSRINKIAVLDNGSGMDEQVLRLALQFGNGTHLDPEDQDGIGKFGMGLPSSSMSQCRRVDVWSWQNGVDSAIYTHLDLDSILNREMREVPEPTRKAIPDLWRKVGNSFGESGTLVVWSNLDRVMWKTARAIIRNSEMLIGRIYRRFLTSDRASIRLHSFNLERPSDLSGIEKKAEPTNPLYLSANTSCPFEVEPMFEPWGEPHVIKIAHGNAVHEVKVTFSVAKQEARSMPQAGNKPHGRHAAKNVGVSVMRAGRELELNQSWTIQYDPRERWWGVEVEFSPGLDNIFGVSNNKQSARNFYQIDINSLLEDDETPRDLKERLEDEDDPAGPLLEVSRTIDKNLSVIREHLKSQREGTRGARTRHKNNEEEQIATEETKARQKRGHKGQSDEEESLPPDQKKQKLKDELMGDGLPENEADEVAGSVVENEIKYLFQETALQFTAPFFSVGRKAGVIYVKLNTNHTAYDSLFEVLNRDDSDAEADELRERLRKTRKGLRLLLLSWARFEDEQEGKGQDRVQDIRFDWGKIARDFMKIMD